MEVYQRWERGILLVGEVMSRPVRTISETSPLPSAIRAMIRYGVACLVVTNQRRPVGMITEGDILVRGMALGLDLKHLTVMDIASKPLIIIEDASTIEAAARIMTTNQIKRLPVLKEGRLVGIITATDIVRKEPVLANLLDELARSKRQRFKSGS